MGCLTITMGAAARCYIALELQNGLYLAQKVLATQDFSQGNLIAYAGSLENQGIIEQRSVEELKWGGVASPQESIECLSLFIRGFLAENKNSLCILENYNAEPTPEWLDSLRSETLFHDQDVFAVVDETHASEGYIKAAVQDSESGWIFIGCLAIVANAGKTLEEKQMTEQTLDDIVAGVQYVIVGAFDGEGYIVWSKGVTR